MQVEQTFFVGAQDVGRNNLAKNKALLEMLSNVATVHANRIGQGMFSGNAARVWVVLHWKLEVFRRPKVCETVRAVTWAQSYTKVTANRDFALYDMKGKQIAAATSDWTVVDPKRRSIQRLTPELMEVYGCEPEHQSFPGFSFPRFREDKDPAERTYQSVIGRSMIDYNHHVHNTAYLDFAEDILPEGHEEECYDHVEVFYKKEVRLGDTITVEYRRCETEDGGPKELVYIKNADGTLLHTAVTLY